MKKKLCVCPHCKKEITINIISKGCIEIDTAFLDSDGEEQIAKKLSELGIEFGGKLVK